MGDGEIQSEPKPVYEVLFDMIIMVSNVFSAINPIKVRYEKASDLFRLVKRTIIYTAKTTKNYEKKYGNNYNKCGKIDKNEIIIKKADDSWF